MSSVVQLTALGLLVYDLTGRDLDLGLLGLAEFIPGLFLMTVTGTVADRFNRRFVITVALTAQIVCSLTIAWYASTGNNKTWPIFLLVACFGAARAFSIPVLRALPADIAPDGGLPRLVAFSATGWQSAIIIGPVIAGFLYQDASNVPFVGAALLMAIAIISIQFVRIDPRHAVSDSDTAAALRELAEENRPAESIDEFVEEPAADKGFKAAFEGFRVIRRNPALLGAISLDLFAVLFGGAFALLPAIAEKQLHVDAVGLGWLRAAGGIGAVVVTVILSVRPIQRRVGPVMFLSVAAFGLFTVVLGWTSSFTVALAAIFLLCAADSVSVYVRSTLVPLVTPSSARGRVMAVEGVFIGASNELGGFESGVLGQAIGTRAAVMFGGFATIGIVGAWILLFPSLWKFDRFPERPPD